MRKMACTFKKNLSPVPFGRITDTRPVDVNLERPYLSGDSTLVPFGMTAAYFEYQ